jgi:hypothetical protein
MKLSALALAMLVSTPFAVGAIRQGGGSTAFVATPIGNQAAIKPQDIVNLDVSGSSIPAGGAELVVYTVPPDRWLVVRDFEFAWDGFGVPSLIEKLGPIETTKRLSFIGLTLHSSLGLAFEPGSEVVLKESSGQGVGVSYALNGYLAAP